MEFREDGCFITKKEYLSFVFLEKLVYSKFVELAKPGDDRTKTEWRFYIQSLAWDKVNSMSPESIDEMFAKKKAEDEELEDFFNRLKQRSKSPDEPD